MTTDTELRELLAKATPGPWSKGRVFWKIGSTRGLADEFWLTVEAGGQIVCLMPEEAPPSGSNAELIVAAVNALPGLLDRVKDRDALEAVAAVRTAHRDRLRDVLLPEARDRTERAEAELERQRGAMRELVDRGVGTDLNPTRLRMDPEADRWWCDYLERHDEQWRYNLRSLLDQAGGA